MGWGRACVYGAGGILLKIYGAMMRGHHPSHSLSFCESIVSVHDPSPKSPFGPAAILGVHFPPLISHHELPAQPAFLQQFSHRHPVLGGKAFVSFHCHCLVLKDTVCYWEAPTFWHGVVVPLPFLLLRIVPGWNDLVSEKNCTQNSPAL